ncbi:MAG: threonylcarbamoyl-AMP synthase [Myxococcales bacterium]|jgi:tRNA threonylcarbamoyl adenosine modification protein (Sua5/YciO/YrdC/YwlC family)|nr:threonylcarbamoyl-AMP synthase [Myxococcales bacterium]
MLLEVNPKNPEPRKIRRAVEALEAGEVIAYPTDTVYGLGCDLFNKKAVESLYRIKGADKSQKLAFVCRDLTDVSKYAIMHDHVYRTLKEFLPGPYVFILESTREVPKIVHWPRKTVGVRVPDHPVALALCAELGRPIISSTAARHGHAPNPDPKEIDEEFKGLALVVDAGPGGTVPTSIVDLTTEEPKIIREGAGDVTAFRA